MVKTLGGGVSMQGGVPMHDTAALVTRGIYWPVARPYTMKARFQL